MSEYNGWSNYETWVVKLWMDNAEGTQEYWQERTRQIAEECRAAGGTDVLTAEQEARGELAEALNLWHEEARPEMENAGVFLDLLRHSLGRVDWDEIATSLMDDQELHAAFWSAEECEGCGEWFAPNELTEAGQLCRDCADVEEGEDEHAGPEV
jgi:hypothetical protein